MNDVALTVNQWAASIIAAWQKSVAGIFEVGRLLIGAKDALPHGQWLELLETKLPFGPRTAQRLMAIARDGRLANATRVSCLPAAWGTLYDLTQLSDEQWALAEEENLIRPDVERGEITKFRKRFAVAQQYTRDVTEPCEVSDLERFAETGVKCGTIYADPPWQYGNQGTRGANTDHYAGMTVQEIADLPVSKFVADDAHLHLWTTNAFLFDARSIIEAWGFEYKSCFVWVKPQMGMGNYWRVSHEFMLLGVCGNAEFGNHDSMSWAEYPRRKHSAKPEEIRTLIERVSPGPRIELFGRRLTSGWYTWGNAIERAVFDKQVEEVIT